MNIYGKNIEVGQVKEAILKTNTLYATYDNQEGEHMPVIRNIFLEDVNVENGGEYDILIWGRETSPVTNVNLTSAHIKNAQIPLSIENAEDVNLKNTTINGEAIN